MKREYKRLKKVIKAEKIYINKPLEEWPHDIVLIYDCIINNLFSNNITVKSIKLKCNLNGNISTRFKYYVGYSPKQFIIKHRIEVAKKILSNPVFEDITITELALSIGYSGNGALVHNFKKQVGQTPNDWRKNIL